jgi:hypothetical protein
LNTENVGHCRHDSFVWKLLKRENYLKKVRIETNHRRCGICNVSFFPCTNIFEVEP